MQCYNIKPVTSQNPDTSSNTQIFKLDPNPLKCRVHRIELDWRGKFASHYNIDGSFKNQTGWDHLGIQSEGAQRIGSMKGLRPGHMKCRYLNK